jgi:hypothetical protein
MGVFATTYFELKDKIGAKKDCIQLWKASVMGGMMNAVRLLVNELELVVVLMHERS